MSKALTVMVQGTASSAGKSIIVAALCRIFKQDGYRVAPFKSQNMALNSFVTAEGGEMGRAQVVQAEAAGIAPTVDMNPVLLKPTTDTGSQVIVMGKVLRNVSARDYYTITPTLLDTIGGAMERLREKYDIVVIEGAGSPAEINLREHEIVNMRIARMFRSPVLLVGDIDKGGVFASLVGTLELLEPEERELVKGIVINKFRGDVTLLQDAIDFTARKTGVPFLGVVPYFRDIRIAQEDSVYLDNRPNQDGGGDLDVTVIRLPHISNYDDFDPLEADGCSVSYVRQRFELGNPHLIIIPGTKSTMADLQALRQTGMANIIIEKARNGIPVIGICGGYQMLGDRIIDAEGVESREKEIPGLGLLDVTTGFSSEKSTTQAHARVACGKGLLDGMGNEDITGYEIHMGRSVVREASHAFDIVETPEGPAGYPDGAVNEKGTVFGTYLHGLFDNDGFRRVFLDNLRKYWGLKTTGSGAVLSRDREYDKLADLVRSHLDIPAVYRIMETMK
jgi:adenosylcobyric acid synthase